MESVPGEVAIVGAGLVGSSWAIVFANSGRAVKVYDESIEVRSRVIPTVMASLSDMRDFGLLADPDQIIANIEVVDKLEDAVGDATYIQESVFERIDIKRKVSSEIAAAMHPNAIVGSSSSGIPASAFTEHLSNRERFLIAHPVNPPHLIPLVELVRAPWTHDDIPAIVRCLMEEVGQAPIYVEREVEGFVLNRLQGALLNEAWALASEGVASVADIDRTITHGLGLRWSFMGPFETIDLNAPGGVADYAQRLGPLYHRIALERKDPAPWSAELIEYITRQRRQDLEIGQLETRCTWRDRRLMALADFRASLNML